MKGQKLSKYAAAFIMILFGTGAVVLLVDAAYTMNEEPDYANINPEDLNADFKH